MDKNNYVVHYRNLQQCLELGMKLKKIHRILKFEQKDWMKPYIDFNAERRKEPTDESDKNHFKLMNNAVYIAKQILLKDFIKYKSRPTCVNWKVLENNLAAIHEKEISLTLNKPIYVGFTVLELSKWEMYNFHYNFMKKKFEYLVFLFTDTESLCYECDEDP